MRRTLGCRHVSCMHGVTESTLNTPESRGNLMASFFRGHAGLYALTSFVLRPLCDGHGGL